MIRELHSGMSDAERAQHAEQVRRARLEVARLTSHWTEIEDDLVRRGHRGRFLVSASSDEIYTTYAGVVFEPGKATAVSDRAQLHWYQDANGRLVFLEKQPRTWSELVARRARREAVRHRRVYVDRRELDRALERSL
jgi:hypothetical protein